MVERAWRGTCDTCGESWWMDKQESTCTCADGGQWMADKDWYDEPEPVTVTPPMEARIIAYGELTYDREQGWKKRTARFRESPPYDMVELVEEQVALDGEEDNADSSHD